MLDATAISPTVVALPSQGEPSLLCGKMAEIEFPSNTRLSSGAILKIAGLLLALTACHKRAQLPLESTISFTQVPQRDLGDLDRIRREFPYARIIVWTTYSGDTQVLRALKAGARGYILKGHVHKELLDAIRAVHAGQKRIPAEIAAQLADHATDDALTEREIDVLRLIGAGNSNNRLPISSPSVKQP